MPEQPQSRGFPEAFVAPHIREAEEAAKCQSGGTEQPLERKDDPKAQEEYTWQFDWTDGRGRRWHGTFRNRVVTIHQKRQIGLMRAHLLGGLPLSSVDLETQALIHMVAWLQTSLVLRPSWFEKPDELNNAVLIGKVFDQVASHEATFHGLDSPEKGGTTAS